MEYMFDSNNFSNKSRESKINGLPINNEPDNSQLILAAKLKQGSKGLLTKRELMIGSYLISGYTVNQIAEALSRSKNTIKMHIRNMKKKCKCETQTKFGVILHGFIKN